MGFGEVLATYLSFMEELLGQPAPRLRHAPRVGAIVDFKRVIETPPAWKQLAIMLSDYIARRASRSPECTGFAGSEDMAQSMSTSNAGNQTRDPLVVNAQDMIFLDG